MQWIKNVKVKKKRYKNISNYNSVNNFPDSLHESPFEQQHCMVHSLRMHLIFLIIFFYSWSSQSFRCFIRRVTWSLAKERFPFRPPANLPPSFPAGLSCSHDRRSDRGWLLFGLLERRFCRHRRGHSCSRRRLAARFQHELRPVRQIPAACLRAGPPFPHVDTPQVSPPWMLIELEESKISLVWNFCCHCCDLK